MARKQVFAVVLAVVFIAMGALCVKHFVGSSRGSGREAAALGVGPHYVGDVHQAQGSCEVIVYITKTGNHYHRDGCRYLRQSRIPITLRQAKALGYAPCSVCNPPTACAYRPQ